MLETLLITWRESLEAALIVGILLAYLARSGRSAGAAAVWAGAGAGVIAALGCAAASSGLVSTLGPDSQELVQAGILFLAVGVLSWMVLWMQWGSRGIRRDLERRADRALATGRRLGLATVAFAAVFREGVETVLFLWGVALQKGAGGVAMLGAGAAGAALAVATAWAFFRGLRLLRPHVFFQVTGVLLLLVAGGLLTAGLNKLIGLGYLPPLIPQVWNTGWLVRDGSPIGSLLAALVGYRSRPSLLEVLALAAYLPPMLWALGRASRASAPLPARSGGASRTGE